MEINRPPYQEDLLFIIKYVGKKLGINNWETFAQIYNEKVNEEEKRFFNTRGSMSGCKEALNIKTISALRGVNRTMQLQEVEQRVVKANNTQLEAEVEQRFRELHVVDQ